MNVENIDKMMKEKKTNCVYMGEFSKDRKGSDSGNWGEGVICVTKTHVGFMGSLAWGPDYYLYYATEFVETRGDFYRIKSAGFKGPRFRSFRGSSLNYRRLSTIRIILLSLFNANNSVFS